MFCLFLHATNWSTAFLFTIDIGQKDMPSHEQSRIYEQKNICWFIMVVFIESD